ncbi:MAG: hydroxyacylglutathione hydrolase [Salinisphaeraceae bacterium]
MPNVFAIPALADNYIWAIADDDSRRAVIVDPGEAEPAAAWLSEHGHTLAAILITHHHPDHTAGVTALVGDTGVPVYGPEEATRACPITRQIADGDRVTIDEIGITLDVLSVPGHTLGHIAYTGHGWLFSGDALFRGGCGRLFEGDAGMMRPGLARLLDLSGDTQVFGGHEYTVKNLSFAAMVEPYNAAVTGALEQARADREQKRPTLPSTLADERAINPFMRWDQPDVIAAAQARDPSATGPDAVFATIRAWKDSA